MSLLPPSGGWISQPVLARADTKREGAELFASRGCTHCHGQAGDGSDQGPSLLKLRKRLSATQIRQQIVHGGKEMPAFGDTLDREQVQSLVVFLRSRNAFPPVTNPGGGAPGS